LPFCLEITGVKGLWIMSRRVKKTSLKYDSTQSRRDAKGVFIDRIGECGSFWLETPVAQSENVYIYLIIS
jgi:hypothetical protein